MSKMIDGGTCQMIADELQKILPDGWKKTVFHCAMSSDSYNMFYYVCVHDEYIQCYALPAAYQVTEEEIDNVFERIYSICGGSECGEVLRFSLIIHRDGKFSAEQEYEDIPLKDWKKQYL